MKRIVLCTILLTFCFFSKAQRATLENDVASYEGKTYAKKDTITLGYGSKSDKDFAFIQIGSAMGGLTDLLKGWAKHEAVIDKVYKTGKTIYLRAKLIDKGVNALGGNKLFIDLEGAVDNKEIK
jgi:hypothetical protein